MARVLSIRNRPSLPVRNNNSSKTASASGSGRTASALRGWPATITTVQQSPPPQLRRFASDPAGYGEGESARRRPREAPERCGVAHPPKREHVAGACGGRGKDLDHGRRRDGNAPPRACEEAHVRGAQSPGVTVGRGVSQPSIRKRGCLSPAGSTLRPEIESAPWRASPAATTTR